MLQDFKDVLLGQGGIILALLSWILVGMISALAYFLMIRPVWYKTTYSELIYDNGRVIEKNYYVTTTTTYVQSGKVVVPIINNTSHYDVTLQCTNVTIKKNNSEIYNKVALHDKVQITYKKKYISPRFYDGEEEFDGYSLESVEVNYENE